MNEDVKGVLYMIGFFITCILVMVYSKNVGESQFVGYVVKTEYHAFPIPRTRITMAYGHPNTVSHAEFFSFPVYGYHEFEYNKFYRITCNATFFQIYKHIKTIEVLNDL